MQQKTKDLFVKLAVIIGVITSVLMLATVLSAAWAPAQSATVINHDGTTPTCQSVAYTLKVMEEGNNVKPVLKLSGKDARDVAQRLFDAGYTAVVMALTDVLVYDVPAGYTPQGSMFLVLFEDNCAKTTGVLPPYAYVTVVVGPEV